MHSMKLATTWKERQRWVQQWAEAASALDSVRREELARLSEGEAWRQTEDLLSLPEIWRDPDRVCGLIAQQAWFARMRKA